MTSRHQSLSSTRGNPDSRLKTADNSAADSDKGNNSNWTKRSARTRERLQPIGADSTQTAPQERQPVEVKTVINPLTKRISSEAVKEKPGTANTKLKDSDEIVVEKREGDNEGGQFLPPIK